MRGVLMIVAVGMLCGALLGLRFRVTILVPAHIIAAIVLFPVAAMGDWSAGRLVVMSLAWSLACQGGYLMGALARASRPRHASPIRRARS